MAHLDWIDDNDIKREVNKVLTKAIEAKEKAENDLERNVIDPFSVLFEIFGFDIPTVEAWRTTEKIRQSQKSLSNAFGTFHQGILGSVPGWRDLGTGEVVDVCNPEKKIIAEIKNKYNTVKGSDQHTVYDSLEKLVMPKASKYYGYTAYYVEIIPKPKKGVPQRYNEAFTPSVKETGENKPANNRIRRIDGASFYALATDQQDALEQLYLSLPNIIKDTYKEKNGDGKFESAFDDAQIEKMFEYFKKAFI